MRNIVVRLAIASPASLQLDRRGRDTRLVLGGDWLVGEAARMDQALGALNFAGVSELAIDGSKISRLDSAGAWLILRTRHRLEATGLRVTDVLLPTTNSALYQRLESEALAPAATHPRRQTFADFLDRIG